MPGDGLEKTQKSSWWQSARRAYVVPLSTINITGEKTASPAWTVQKSICHLHLDIGLRCLLATAKGKECMQQRGKGVGAKEGSAGAESKEWSSARLVCKSRCRVNGSLADCLLPSTSGAAFTWRALGSPEHVRRNLAWCSVGVKHCTSPWLPHPSCSWQPPPQASETGGPAEKHAISSCIGPFSLCGWCEAHEPSNFAFPYILENSKEEI